MTDARNLLSKSRLFRRIFLLVLPVYSSTSILAQELPPPVTKAAQKFIVTSGEKTEEHPFYEKGSKMGFAIDGVFGKELVLTRGVQYEFDVDTSVQHDFYFSTRAKGRGGGTVTEGISGQFVYKGMIKFTPNEAVPGRLFYACRNHEFMGGLVHVINDGETVVLEGSRHDLDKPVVAPVSVGDVKEKIAFVKMMVTGQASQKVKHSSDSSAKGLLRKASAEIAVSEAVLEAGDTNAALKAANTALDMANAAIKMVPAQNSSVDHLAKYASLFESFKIYKESYEQQYMQIKKNSDESLDAQLDPNAIQKMNDDAVDLSSKGQYAQANELLVQAQEMLIVALTSAYEGKELVYDKNFESPVAEFQYELARFKNYEHLVPIAIEKRRPSASAIDFMNRYLEKGQKIAAEAQELAKTGDYDTAVLGLQEATKQIQKALVAAGVR